MGIKDETGLKFFTLFDTDYEDPVNFDSFEELNELYDLAVEEGYS